MGCKKISSKKIFLEHTYDDLQLEKVNNGPIHAQDAYMILHLIMTLLFHNAVFFNVMSKQMSLKMLKWGSTFNLKSS